MVVINTVFLFDHTQTTLYYSKKWCDQKKKTVGVHTTVSAHSCFGTSTYFKDVNLCQFYQKG
jgi:hypothetical protein